MNIYDIATEAGVSISTVSRVLNNTGRVGAKTRKKVQDVMDKYNYAPSALARGLVYQSTKSIGIMTSDVRNYHFAETAYMLENIFFSWGYSTILCNTGNKSEKKKDYIRILAEKKVDGIVLVGSVFTEIEIEDSILNYLPNTPIVCANSTLKLPDIHAVLIDQDWGMFQAVKHLKERGHTNIIFVRTSLTYNSKRKIKGFFRAMKEFNLPCDEQSVVECSYGLGGSDAVDQMLSMKNRHITAMIYADDSSALAGVRRLKTLGYRIPDDVAVIGYDNSNFSLYADPQLTTIDTKSETFSVLVADMLNDVLNKRETGSSVLLRPELIVRDST